MPNSLGAMVFLVAGIAMGYWVLTGRAGAFMYALKQGSGSNMGGANPPSPPSPAPPNQMSGEPTTAPGTGVASTTWGPQAPGVLAA